MHTNLAVADAIVRGLLIEIAPRWRADVDADPRVAADPGLRAASGAITAWLKELGRNRDRALAPQRLADILRRTFVCAAGRGRICVPANADFSPWIEIASEDMAFVETVRELATTLDMERGTSVATEYDAHRDGVLARAFELARRAAEQERWRRTSAGR